MRLAIAPEAVPHLDRVGPGEGGQRDLRTEHTHAEEGGGELDGPHARRGQRSDVDERGGAVPLEPDEPDEDGAPEGDEQPGGRTGQALQADDDEATEDEQEAEAEQARAGQVEAAGGGSRLVPHAEDDGHEGERRGGSRDGEDRRHAPDRLQRTGRQGTDDDADLERHDEQRGSPPDEGGLVGRLPRALVEDGDLHRQPHRVGPLQRPADEEGPESRREGDQPPTGSGDERRGDEHAPMAVEVTDPGEDGDGQGSDDELDRLEPVDVAIGDAEMVGDVAVDRGVVALQDPGGDLDRGEEADEPPDGGAHRDARSSPSESSSMRYQRIPSRKSTTPMRSS